MKLETSWQDATLTSENEEENLLLIKLHQMLSDNGNVQFDILENGQAELYIHTYE